MDAFTPYPCQTIDTRRCMLFRVRLVAWLHAVVEKSPAITGSKVAQRLLLEAYRFQAMTSTDAVDVDEHFPGNHRVKVGSSDALRF